VRRPLFRDFAELCRALERTSSTTEKRELIAGFLKRLPQDEWKPFVLLLTGRVLPETGGRPLNVGYATIRKASSSRLKTLLPLPPPTISEVYSTLRAIARVSGSDVQRKRTEMLASLLSRLSDEERRYLIRSIGGEMRVGANIGLVLQALAEAGNVDPDVLRKAYLLCGDIGEVAERVARGEVSREALKPRLFTPVKPMLAASANTVEEALQLAGGRAAVEVKYDGIRVQIHVGGGGVRVFSRRLTDITENLPEVVDVVRERVRVREAILEGEVIAVDENGRPMPFQDLMKRFKRVKGFEQVARKIPVRLYLFDILYLDGSLLIDQPYHRRYEALASVVPPDLLAERIVTDSVEEAREFYRRAVESGHEGVMVKRLDAPYVMGVRGANWIKVKEVETIDAVIVGAEWGHGRRSGWLSDYYLAVYDPESDGYLIVGKTFKGLTDEEFEWITRKLLELKVADEGHRIWVRPEIVVEVAFNEIQRSRRYRSGFALRFARIVRFRLDKSPRDATTIQELRELYEKSELS